MVGGRAELARRLGITPVAVWQWASTGAHARAIPPRQCIRIEALTGGRVTRRHLRPEDWMDFWPEFGETGDIGSTAPAKQAQAAIKTVAQEVA